MARQTQMNFLSSNNFARITKETKKKLTIELEEGEFNKNEVWFLQDELENEFIVIPKNAFRRIVNAMQSASEEKIQLQIAKFVSQNLPVDFDDVMAVALKILESKRLETGMLPPIDAQDLVNKIKQDYPNLFFKIPNELFSRVAKIHNS